ncbi:MAG: hypothetical protein ACRDZX_17245 [Acidimicrobiales bacterium]
MGSLAGAALPGGLWAGATGAGAAPAPRSGLADPGEVAYISGSQIYLTHGNGGRRRVAGPGQASDPAWSADGNWVAFLRSPAPPAGSPYAAEPSQLWVARPDSSGAYRLSSAGSDVTGFAWGPAGAGEEIAFSTTGPRGLVSQIWLARPGRATGRAFASVPGLFGFSWSPSGGALAVSRNVYGPDGFRRATLEIAPLAGRAWRTVRSGGNAFELASWWPNGKGLLYWADPESSASLAADGLALESLDLADGRVSRLAVTLVHPNWLAWSPGGTAVAIVAGGNRSIWSSGKHVEVCALPAGRCRPMPRPAGPVMSLGPAWASSGALTYVVAPAARGNGFWPPPGAPGAPGAPGGAAYRPKTLAWWYGAQRLWSSGPGATGARPLAAAGRGAHTPVATAGGLLFVRGGGLWYLPTGAASPSRLAGHLGPADPYGDDYYGYVPWSDDFAWHQ